MIRGKLTERRVQRAKPGKYGDGGGLYLEVGENSASWTYRWERAGKDRYLGLGSLRDVDLTEARELAREARRLVKAGGDPLVEKHAQRAAREAAAAKQKTFGECAAMFFADRRDGWHPAQAAQWSSNMLGVLLDGRPSEADYTKALRSKPVAMVDTTDVLATVRPLWATMPVKAARVLNWIAQVLGWATAAKLRSGENPASRDTIRPLLPKVKHKHKHHDAVPWRELPGLMHALRKREGSPARALEFAILTSARTDECLAARWLEISWDDKLWIVPAERMKGGEEHKVPLAPYLIDLLTALPRSRDPQDDLIFLSSVPGRPLARNALQKMLKRLDRSETPHGMRASFSTWASDVAHAPPPVIEASLAHKINSEVERSYKRGTLLDRRRDLMTKWATYCTTPPVKSADESADKVVPLRGTQ
jgi:integrase